MDISCEKKVVVKNGEKNHEFHIIVKDQTAELLEQLFDFFDFESMEELLEDGIKLLENQMDIGRE